MKSNYKDDVTVYHYQDGKLHNTQTRPSDKELLRLDLEDLLRKWQDDAAHNHGATAGMADRINAMLARHT